MIKPITLYQRNHWTLRPFNFVPLRSICLTDIQFSIIGLQKLRKILSQLSLLYRLNFLRVHIHLAFLKKFRNGDHTVQIRLR